MVVAPSDDAVIEWLLDGDPAIRWQVMGDLLDAPLADWARERRRTAETAWAAELVGHQGSGGEWPKGRGPRRPSSSRSGAPARRYESARRRWLRLGSLPVSML